MGASASQVPVLVVASTFYTPALERPFADALASRGDTRQLLVVPYNQLSGFLLNPASIIPSETAANVILMIRVEDLVRPELAKGKDLSPESIKAAFQERMAHLTSLLVGSHLKLTVVICPSGRSCHHLAFLGPAPRIVEHKLSAALRLRQRHLVLDWFEWPDFAHGVSTGDWLNLAGDRLGHVPFTPKALQAIAEYFVARLDTLPVTSLGGQPGDSNNLALEKFLGTLELEFNVAPMLPADEQTVVDLVRHTTHFVNLVDRKWDRKLLQDFATRGESWIVRVRDRFGDYGISGATTFEVQSGVMRVRLLFLTCPVLGKQVEHALFAWMAQLAAERTAEFIEVPFVRGRDNEGMCKLLSSLSEEPEPALPSGSEKTFRVNVAGLADRVTSKAVNPAAVAEVLSAMSAGSAA